MKSSKIRTMPTKEKPSKVSYKIENTIQKDTPQELEQMYKDTMDERTYE